MPNKILTDHTSAFAALHVRLQFPALIAGALDTGFLLFAFLATLEVLGTEALDLAGLVVSSQFHAQGTRAHEALPRNDAAVVATATIVQSAQVYRQEIKIRGLDYIRDRFECCL